MVEASGHERTENKRTKVVKGVKFEEDMDMKIGGDHKFEKSPEWLQQRLEFFDRLYAEQQAKYDDGKVKQGKAFETTPLMVAKEISNSLPDKVVVAKVKYSKRVATLDVGLVDAMEEKDEGSEDWIQYDAWRPLEGDCHLQLLKFEDPEGCETFWHSSAHILGEALEREFGVHLCHGPPTEQGFFYDSYTGHDMFKEENYKQIEEAAKKVTAEKQTFQRLVLSKLDALNMFVKNPFKVSLISNKIPDDGNVTVYKCGNLIDLCTGPHLPHTGRIKAFKVTKNSSAYWLGKAANDSLQRIYGITFPSKKQLDEWVHFQEEAAKRGHKRVGEAQGLFHFNALSPGSAFFYPHGAHIYNKLMNVVRHQYAVRGYQEVISPNMFNIKLWKVSGHYANYKDNIFLFKSENQGFGVKPMNCPGHCLMFDSTIRSYRDLPLRYADFGVLHRNEISGALHGLTRVRRFQQDDAHIFCQPNQLMAEVLGCLDFLKYIYDLFGLNFELELSTRPADFLGEIELWNEAEENLKKALDSFGLPWKINEGDGAFYGPKIDIKVTDCLKRQHQCGTVQLDFQLPIRFNLQYQTDHSEEMGKLEKSASSSTDQSSQRRGLSRQKTMQHFKKDEWDPEDYVWHEHDVKKGYARPVIVHRAILGSVERFMAILIEHLAGKWPYFVSPRQVLVCPLSEKFHAYCKKVHARLHKEGVKVELNLSNETLNKKIRNGQLEQFNYIVVCGEQEEQTGTIDIRTREGGRKGKMQVHRFVEFLKEQEPKASQKELDLYSEAWNEQDYPELSEEQLEELNAAPAKEPKEEQPKQEKKPKKEQKKKEKKPREHKQEGDKQEHKEENKEEKKEEEKKEE